MPISAQVKSKSKALALGTVPLNEAQRRYTAVEVVKRG